MSSFALLRVSARTDLPDIAAVGIIFLKLAGSSDTMQTVERTEEPIAPARVDRAARGGGGRKAAAALRRAVSLLSQEENKEAASCLMFCTSVQPENLTLKLESVRGKDEEDDSYFYCLIHYCFLIL